jgi:hypothetical protein
MHKISSPTTFSRRSMVVIVASAAVALLAAYYGLSKAPKAPNKIDDFVPKVGMTFDEVKAALDKPSWEYLDSDSGDPIPGERFGTRRELGYGDFRTKTGDGFSVRKHHLLLRFEGWRVWDVAGRLVEDHPLQLDSWERNTPP